jgi:hypothetical protein
MSNGTVRAMALSLLFATAIALADAPENDMPLRTVYDAPRQRLWLLRHDAVYLHDAATLVLKGRYELPGWIYAHEQYACAPELALDAQGVAVVTSNVIAALWRVDPARPRATQHELVLDDGGGRDIGFSGLVYAPDQGVFFAASSSHGLLWRIDPLLRRAQNVPLSAPIRGDCGLSLRRTRTRRAAVLCSGRWAIQLAPDQRSGYVFDRSCAHDSGL